MRFLQQRQYRLKSGDGMLLMSFDKTAGIAMIRFQNWHETDYLVTATFESRTIAICVRINIECVQVNQSMDGSCEA